MIEVELTRRRLLHGDLAVDAFQFVCDTRVEVWCLAVEDIRPSVLVAGLGLLQPEERERHSRFRFQRDRDVYVAKRLLVRGALSAYAAVTPDAWRFVLAEHGRPRIAEECGLQFSLSSSQGLAVCAVTRRPGLMGVDVEDLARPQGIEVAEWVLADTEQERLARLPEEQRQTAFLRYWTLKEAYVKARGLGLSLPVAEAAFEIDSGGDIGVLFGNALQDDPARWRFEQTLVLGRYIVALAAAEV